MLSRTNLIQPFWRVHSSDRSDRSWSRSSSVIDQIDHDLEHLVPHLPLWEVCAGSSFSVQIQPRKHVSNHAGCSMMAPTADRRALFFFFCAPDMRSISHPNHSLQEIRSCNPTKIIMLTESSSREELNRPETLRAKTSNPYLGMTLAWWFPPDNMNWARSYRPGIYVVRKDLPIDQ